MATIKSFTTLEQSKKLAKILPLESADMYYISGDKDDICFGSGVYEEIADWLSDGTPRPADIPCWSLAALLDVLPNNENISTNLSKGGYRISTLEYTNSWFVDYEDETDGLNNCVTSADNPVDACVEMIIRLSKNELI